ncbi:MAG: replicative DNA helicase [Alphaproteobacteria bacterium CG_4_10_14_0_8_um_filter_53_9]|nr:MAG: replicative DNA helicase [Alphaproteobacteria bacterium CG_4_10_14_0_8_um_filter_53_9]
MVTEQADLRKENPAWGGGDASAGTDGGGSARDSDTTSEMVDPNLERRPEGAASSLSSSVRNVVASSARAPMTADANRPMAAMAPHSVTAEQALLGCLMVNNRLYDDLGGVLLSSHFYVPLHAAIFEALDKLINRGREANPITLREHLRGTIYDDEQALLPHLTSMFENAGLSGEVKGLAEVIHTTYLQRQLMVLADGARQQAQTAHRHDEVTQVLDALSGELFALAETGVGTSTVRGLRGPLVEVIQRAEAAKADGSGITGVTSGFADIDSLIGGWQKSDLVILAARPSMGKTALALNLAEHAARKKLEGGSNGAAVGVFSLEMGADQLAARLLSSRAGVSAHQLSNGQLSSADFTRITAAANDLAELPLYIDDTPNLSINALRSRARRMKRQYGIGFLIVDYLQLMQGTGKYGDGNRVQEVSEISMGLKQIARELQIPVIALSQLSRAVESRDNKRPQLSDLRESGSIEQDADLVVFLYREEYYLQRQLGADGGDGDEKSMKQQERLEQVRGKAEVLFGKNRKGPTGVVQLMFHGETTTFHNFAGPRADPSDYE